MLIKVSKSKYLFSFICLALVLVACSNKNLDNPKDVLQTYISFIKEKKVDEAYAMLDKNNLPEKAIFTDSIYNEKEISLFEIINSKKVDKNTYKFLANVKVGGMENQMVFVLIKDSDKWYVSLNTDPSKEVEF